MNGKWPAMILVAATLAAGGGVWYAQEYGFYETLDPAGPDAVILATPAGGGAPAQLAVSDFQGIDADSSPMRWRACFRLAAPPAPQDFTPYPDATPLIGPRWFDCYDAGRITADLASGAAKAVLGQSGIRPDVDRVLAIYPDGRAYGWHQFNDKTPERGVMD
ncbi:DUF6446 family protein [Paracoccus sp. (in: a-proteobacteria)]|uniref:DUF6446 family protein n=1 Tax=Paracoccus sp. TaxID=267 RepID=UPI003A879EEC